MQTMLCSRGMSAAWHERLMAGGAYVLLIFTVAERSVNAQPLIISPFYIIVTHDTRMLSHVGFKKLGRKILKLHSANSQT